MLVAQPTQAITKQSDRVALLIPSLERVATEAKELELDTNTVIKLLKNILEGKT